MRVFFLLRRRMFPVRRQINPHAARLRREQMDVEQRFWLAVRDRRLDGFKFRRQVTIGSYVVDFLCVEAGLVVELDGGQHNEQVDSRRTGFLVDRGLRVIRFWNNDVAGNLEGVLWSVSLAIQEQMARKKKTLTQPSSAKAGEG